MHTCKAWFTLAGELINAVSTRGAIMARIASTLVVVILAHCTCIHISKQIICQPDWQLSVFYGNDHANLKVFNLTKKSCVIFFGGGEDCSTALGQQQQMIVRQL